MSIDGFMRYSSDSHTHPGNNGKSGSSHLINNLVIADAVLAGSGDVLKLIKQFAKAICAIGRKKQAAIAE